MILCFTLSMPGCNSWDGRWSGADRLWARIIPVRSRKAGEKLIGYYSYNFRDGWRAAIDVKEVTPAEARAIRKKSRGFYGYDWMINSILTYGKIMDDEQIKEHLANAKKEG